MLTSDIGGICHFDLRKASRGYNYVSFVLLNLNSMRMWNADNGLFVIYACMGFVW